MVEVSVGSVIISFFVLCALLFFNFHEERNLLPTPIRMNGHECNLIVINPEYFPGRRVYCHRVVELKKKFFVDDISAQDVYEIRDVRSVYADPYKYPYYRY